MNWQDLNWLDYTILGVIGFSVLVSLVRGFIREALSLIIWVGAFWISYRCGHAFAAYFLSSIKGEGIRLALGYGLVFLAVLVAGAVISFIVSRLVYGTGMSGTDRVLGVVFGLARGIFLVSVMTLVVPLTAVSKSSWWEESQLIPQFEGLALYLRAMLPEKMDQIPILANEKKDLDQISAAQAATMTTSAVGTNNTNTQ